MPIALALIPSPLYSTYGNPVDCFPIFLATVLVGGLLTGTLLTLLILPALVVTLRRGRAASAFA